MNTNGKPPPPFTPNEFRHHDAITGQALADAIEHTEEARPYLVENLILAESLTLISSDPGQGKTCITLMIASQGSIAVPVFGDLHVPKPFTTYIFCPERSSREMRERLKLIRQTIPFDVNRIIIDDGMRGLVNLENPRSKEALFQSIHRNATNGIDLLIVDALYGMTAKPLASEETANMLYRFNARVLREFNCNILYNNHNTKTRFTGDGSTLPPNPFGSQMIMANATAAFTFGRLPGPHLSQLKMVKDTVSGLANEITLTFDPETFTLSSLGAQGIRSRKEKLRRYLNTCHHDSKLCSYDDMSKASDLGNDSVKRYISPWVHLKKIVNTSDRGFKALWRIAEPV